MINFAVISLPSRRPVQGFPAAGPAASLAGKLRHHVRPGRQAYPCLTWTAAAERGGRTDGHVQLDGTFLRRRRGSGPPEQGPQVLFAEGGVDILQPVSRSRYSSTSPLVLPGRCAAWNLEETCSTSAGG